MMRITSGIRRGKKLLSLAGDNTRPTLERVKQAFFNAIQFEISDKVVLDLFSGSGQLGLEALSRGAQYCFFNDISKDACDIIKKNINACDFAKISYLTCKSYTDCVKIIKDSKKQVSLVFLDPPYSQGLVNDALDCISKNGILENGAIIVCESSDTDVVSHADFTVRKEYRYSGIKVTLLCYERKV